MHACRRQDVAGRGGCFCISVASPQLQSLIACTVRVRLRRPNKSGGTPRGCTRARDKPVRTHALRCTAAAHRSAAPSGSSASACSSAQQSAATSQQPTARSISQLPAATPCRRAVRVPVTRHSIDLHVLTPRFLGKATPLPPTLRTPFPSRGEKNTGDLTSPSSHTFACVRVVKCTYVLDAGRPFLFSLPFRCSCESIKNADPRVKEICKVDGDW